MEFGLWQSGSGVRCDMFCSFMWLVYVSNVLIGSLPRYEIG